MKDIKFLRGTKDNNLSRVMSNNSLKHPGSKSVKEDRNVISIVPSPNDYNKMKEDTTINIKKKNKSNIRTVNS